MKNNSFIWHLLWIITAALFIASCGGGGGGGDGGTSTTGFTPADLNTPMSIDQNNAITTIGLIAFAYDMSENTGSTLFLSTDFDTDTNDDGVNRSIVNKVLDLTREHFYLEPTYDAAWSDSNQESCTNGGSLSVTVEWDSPQNPSNECMATNIHATITASNCQLDSDSYINGTMILDTPETLCEPSALVTTLSNLTIRSGSTQIAARSLTITCSNLQWNAYDEIIAGTLVSNGQFVISDSTHQAGVALNNFREVLTTATISVSGQISGPCLDGWATIETIQAVDTTSDDCPDFGQIRIYGDGGSVLVVFNGSEISIGQNTISCSELEDIVCPIP